VVDGKQSERPAPEPPLTPIPRRRHRFRGHVVVGFDEPLPVADRPADPPPAAPLETDDEVSHGQ
jgi:hypothetical protein